ncbi:unnamed protein product [Dovyalis caffra]|nr:unnamed protein product [Dovyalis caffra]
MIKIFRKARFNRDNPFLHSSCPTGSFNQASKPSKIVSGVVGVGDFKVAPDSRGRESRIIERSYYTRKPAKKSCFESVSDSRNAIQPVGVGLPSEGVAIRFKASSYPVECEPGTKARLVLMMKGQGVRAWVLARDTTSSARRDGSFFSSSSIP